jgi:hypothetical protein
MNSRTRDMNARASMLGRWRKKKDVPGHIPSKVQTGLRSKVELREKAAHETRPRRCLAWPRESRRWQVVVAGRWQADGLCNATLVVRDEATWWCKGRW